MRIEEEELVFYDEKAEKAEAEETARIAEEDDIRLSGLKENPYISQADIYELLESGEDDPDVVDQLLKRKAKRREQRRKTGRITGNFWLDLLAGLIFSPFRFKTSAKTLAEFINLGQYQSENDDLDECEKLYQWKKETFWYSIMTKKFLGPAFGEILIFLTAVFGLTKAIARIGAGHWGLWNLIVLIVAIIVVWISLKSFMRSVLSVMRATIDTVKDKSEKDAKAKKAREDAKKKAKAEAEKEAKKQSKTKAEQPKKTPLPPSSRGRNRQSGG